MMKVRQRSGWTQKGVSSSGTWISPLSVCLLKNGENVATPIILFLGHLSRSVLPSGLHCPNLSSSGLMIFWHAFCIWISLCLATVIAWVLLFLSPSFVVVPLLLGDSSFYRYLDFYWILRGSALGSHESFPYCWLLITGHETPFPKWWLLITGHERLVSYWWLMFIGHQILDP